MDSKPFLQFESGWNTLSSAFELSRGRVDLWRLQLNQSERDLTLQERVLDVGERARADRFHFARDRRRFIAARAQLRSILGKYLGMDPRTLTFSYGPRGKPHLNAPIGFNITHSGELSLVAVACERDVGVDLEELRAMENVEDIAERFFSARENAELQRLQSSARQEAFFCCWTLKEAYVKATGDGLAQPTEAFDVGFARGGPVRLLNVEGDSEESCRWELLGFFPASGYVGALAVEGHDWELSRYDYHP